MLEENQWIDIGDDLSSKERSASVTRSETRTSPTNGGGDSPIVIDGNNGATPNHNFPSVLFRKPIVSKPLTPAPVVKNDLWGDTYEPPPTSGEPFEDDLEDMQEEADDEDFSDELSDQEIISHEDETEETADFYREPLSESEDSADLFTSLEQASSLLAYDTAVDADALLESLELIDVEAELVEQGPREAEAILHSYGDEAPGTHGRGQASGWMGSTSVLYIDWQDQEKAEQEALDRLGYAKLTISESTRAFIVQTARAAKLTGRREKELTSELDDVRTQLAQLPNQAHYETTLNGLIKQIAELDRMILSGRFSFLDKELLTTQLRECHSTLAQLLNEDPHRAKRDALKAKIAEIERTLVSNLQWVAVKKAPHFLGKGVELDDLIQTGLLGVIAGIKHFDSSRGTRLLVAVNWWVFQALTRAVMNDGRLIHLPVHVHEPLAQIKRLHTEMEMRLGRLPTRRELANALNLSMPEMERYIQADRKIVPLDPYICAEDDNEGYSFQPVEEALVVNEDDFDQSTEAGNIDSLLNRLSVRQKKVIELRFGLKDGSVQTLEEIGKRMRLTRERIRQIQNKAIKKMQLAYPSLKAAQK